MSTCESTRRDEEYNLSLHVGALFIVLGVSAGACVVPVTALRVPRVRIPLKVHFGFRHFGTGVLIATAFVHLLPTAFVSLTNPCLPPFFNEDYPALAGAIALAAVFLITIAEMAFSPVRPLRSVQTATESQELDALSHTSRPGRRKSHSGMSDEITSALSIPQFGQTRTGRSHGVMKTIDAPSTPDSARRHSTDSPLTTIEETGLGQQRKKLLTQCVLLECGILFHSIFIGLALAVAVGGEQIILLIAIVFHQTFEGLALGSRIAAVDWNPNAIQPWLMAVAYGCTTPLGQAIGIATRNLYDPGSATGLLVVGTFNAFSAGLLAYTSLVDLLNEDFLSDHSWKTLRGTKRIVAMSLVIFGAFCMSLIGAWA
ncbi:hypothetical protein SLS60_010624 [Paraconiothyrium brasiliense]|uniref:Zinc/iron permease n=1 Tax=Paraconiothyrium brasiliense TaxID=300254 RepID=A0ABR3QP08_9PLEO